MKKITAAIESVIGLRVLVKLMPPHSLVRSEGKAKRVIDNRVH
jgi:phenylacetate-CoA ligase